MNFGRRAFLQFAAGAVGGSLLSPLPWQLAGDTARWSQNWSWRPSPERGEVTKVPGICAMCEGGCAIQARLVNGHRAILIEGNPANPVTEGGICALGASSLQFLYAPYRIVQPMKQQKARGDVSGFKPISWDEALSDLGKKLGAMKTGGKQPGLAAIVTSRQSSMNDLWQQFFAAYGSPNLFRMPSAADGFKFTAQLATGNAQPFVFALGNAEYVISFGANLFEGAGCTCLASSAVCQWAENGTKLVQVESRCSLTASKADKFLAVKPGKEALLAMGIAHVMVSNGSYDVEFVKNNVFGFEDWTDASGKKRQGFKSLVTSAAYSPEEVSKATGVDAGKIREVAGEFAGKPKALAVWGIGQQTPTDGSYNQLVFTALNVLKGNLKPNGLITLAQSVPLADLPAVPAADAAPKAGLYAFLDGLSSGKGAPAEVLLVHGCNPLYSLPETKLVQAALGKVPTLVSFSSYMDETAAQADLILPNHTSFERFDDAKGVPGAAFGYYAVGAPILKPLYDTKHSGEALMTLAAAIGGPVGAALPWKTYEEFLKFRVAGLAKSQKGAVAEKADIGLAKLAAGDSVQPNFSDADLWKKLTTGHCWYNAPAALPNPVTPSGKVELAYQAIAPKTAAEDKYCLPHFEDTNPPGNETELPLLLVAYKPGFTTGGYVPNAPFMNKLIPNSVLKDTDVFIELSPDTAAKYELLQGDVVTLKTTQGEAAVRVNISPAAGPGVVYLPTGLGHKAYDEYVQNKGVNANSLMEAQLDPVTGVGTVWACRAQLRRA